MSDIVYGSDQLKPTLVIDDIVDASFADFIEKTIFAAPWQFMYDVTGREGNPYPSMGFVNVMKMYGNGVVSPLYEIIAVPIINAIIEKTDLKISDVSLARSYLQTPLHPKFVKKHNGVHIDWHEPHLVVVYYVNDADGLSFVFEENYLQKQKYPEQLEDIVYTHTHKTVTAKKGRVLIFDGYRYHASSQPQNGPRCILDFNLEMKDD